MSELTRIVGVYDADHTLRGELSYVLGHLIGTRNCDLCTITHGPLRRKSATATLVDAVTERFGVPLELIHRDEQTPTMNAVSAGHLACVLAEIDGRWRIVVDRPTLQGCAGEPGALLDAVCRALDDERSGPAGTAAIGC